MSFIAIYITHASKENAQKLCNKLLEQHLIACANIFPIQSHYHWQGNIERDDEWVSIVKTQKKHWKTLRDLVLKIHPYTTPCIMKIKVKANKDYEDWIKETTEIQEQGT